MKRREMITATGAASLGLILTACAGANGQTVSGSNSGDATGQAVVPQTEMQIQTGSDISANHGHIVEVLNLKEVILALRDIHENGSQTLDIQGNSGHPHAVELTEDALVELLVTSKVDLKSTVVAGHSHDVELSLIVE